MTLRPARPQDAARLAQVHEASIRELAARHYGPAQIDAWVERARAHWPKREVWDGLIVAEDAGKVCGFGELDLEQQMVTLCYVHPESAGRGVGSALLEQLEEMARAAGLEHLRLRSSVNAEPFYRKHGWVEYARTSHCLTEDVTALDAVEMEKSLIDRQATNP